MDIKSEEKNYDLIIRQTQEGVFKLEHMSKLVKDLFTIQYEDNHNDIINVQFQDPKEPATILFITKYNNKKIFKCYNFYGPILHEHAHRDGHIENYNGYFYTLCTGQSSTTGEKYESTHIFSWEEDEWAYLRADNHDHMYNDKLKNLLTKVDLNCNNDYKNKMQEDIKEIKTEMRYVSSMLKQILGRKQAAIDFIQDLTEMHNIESEEIFPKRKK